MESLQELSILNGPQKSRKVQLMHRIFEERVDQECGNKTAIIFNENRINYNTLNSKANRLCAAILGRINKSDIKTNQDGDWAIVVSMVPSDSLIITLLAIWKCGAAYVPIDPSFPLNRFAYILKETQPVLVIHDTDVDPEKLSSNESVSFDVLHEESKNFSNANIKEDATLNSLQTDPIAVILYTSGSTGKPKGVRLPHSVIANRLFWQWEQFPYSPTEDVGAFKTALTFVDHIPEIWGPLLSGMAVLCIPRDCTKNPENLIHLLEDHKVERLFLVPTLLKTILMFLKLQTNSKILQSLKIWLCSNETLSMSLAREFFDYFTQSQILCNFYGSTEIMDVSYFICDSMKSLDSLQCIPIGHPIDNTNLYILDGDMKPVPQGEIGELYVSGMNLARGYVNNTEGFTDNPLDPKHPRLFKTGDFARIVNSALIFEGRTDSQVKIRGHRLNLNEVEEILLQLPEVERATVLCYNPGEVDQTLVAFIVPTAKSQIKEIQSKFLGNIPEYMVPKLMIVDEIPTVVNGKVDRQLLMQQYVEKNVMIDYSGIRKDQLHVAKDLFKTIKSVIRRSRGIMSLRSNFFELGGNSLNSVITVTQLCEKGYKIGITQFIEAKNLGDILQIITQETSTISDKDECLNLNLKTIPLNNTHKEDVIEILATSFHEKGELPRYLKPHLRFEDGLDYTKAIWNFVLEKNLSFVVVNEDNLIMGVALNIDAKDQPEINVTSSEVHIILEFLEFIEHPIIENMLPFGMNVHLYALMLGTNAKLSGKENVKVTQFMEEQTIEVAKRNKFTGVLTINSSPLTQQLGTVMGYKDLLTYQINQYVHKDGSRPFGKAPDTDKVIIHWKQISDDNN